jgi:ribosomal protein S24E
MKGAVNLYLSRVGVAIKLQVQNKAESKLLDRYYVELLVEDSAGKLTRKEAVAELAKELGVPEERIGLVRLEEQSGTRAVLGKFHVYGSKEAKKRLHQRYLDERSLSKEEREKLRQEKKKAKTAVPAPEVKK